MVFLDSNRLKDFQREKVRDCVREVRESSHYAMMSYKIQSNSFGRIDNVCEKTFKKVWCITDNRLNTLKKEIKTGTVVSERKFNESTKVPEKTLSRSTILFINIKIIKYLIHRINGDGCSTIRIHF